MKRALCLAGALTLASCHHASRVPAGVTVLYDVAFEAPEQTVGQTLKVRTEEAKFPLKVPSRIFLGSPTVVDKLCRLDHQPLQLSLAPQPATGYTGDKKIEGVEFELDPGYKRYHAELDVCVLALGQPTAPTQLTQLNVFLDVPDAYGIGFIEGGRIGLLDPTKPETQSAPIAFGLFVLNHPQHLGIDLDVVERTWTISVDGTKVYSGPIQALYGSSLRVVLRGTEKNVAALDNVLIWAEGPVQATDLPAEPNQPAEDSAAKP
jgi:hypothetical protein